MTGYATNNFTSAIGCNLTTESFFKVNYLDFIDGEMAADPAIYRVFSSRVVSISARCKYALQVLSPQRSDFMRQTRQRTA
jgi:hypothetical protein